MKKIGILFIILSNFIFSKEIKKIVTLSPSVTQLVIDLGDKKNIIECDKFSKKISNLSELNGSLNADNINVEEILNLNPDLVLISSHNLIKGKKKLEILKEFGINFYIVKNPKNLDEIGNSIEEIGNILGKKLKGKELKKFYLSQVDKLKSPNKNKTFFLEISGNPMFTTGNNTFLNSALEHLGIKNIFSFKDGWFSPSLENIIEKNPDIIFVIGKDHNLEKYFPKKKIIYLDENITLPTPKIIDILEEINEKII